MEHHLEIDTVLDVVAVQNRGVPVDDHVLCMERAYRRTVVVLDLQENTGDLARIGKFDFVARVSLGLYGLMRRDDLRRIASVIHWGYQTLPCPHRQTY